MAMQKIILASNNPGKLREFKTLLMGVGLDVIPQSDFHLESVEETGLSFVENAIIKARYASKASGLPAIADDSGIEVDALHGRPGIYSARFAGVDASDSANNNLLLELLRGFPIAQRRARYQCVLVYMRFADDPTPVICQAAWEGVIAEAPSGAGGFGYDPLFYLPEYNCTSAELAPELKNQLSHRGRAMAQLLSVLAGSGSADSPQ